MAAGEEAWKVLVREQAAKAADRCARAHAQFADSHRLLAVAIGDLETPAIMDNPEAWRVAAGRAEGKLPDASDNLAAAASLMAAARLIALRGGAASPEPPLRSVDDVPDEALRGVLALLEEAMDHAEDACDLIDVCRAHLVGVGRLLGHPLLPGLKGLVNVKLVSARDNLESAQGFEEESTSLVHDSLFQLLLI